MWVNIIRILLLSPPFFQLLNISLTTATWQKFGGGGGMLYNGRMARDGFTNNRVITPDSNTLIYLCTRGKYDFYKFVFVVSDLTNPIIQHHRTVFSMIDW